MSVEMRLQKPACERLDSYTEGNKNHQKRMGGEKMENLKKGEAQSRKFVMYSLIFPCLFPHGFRLPLCCVSLHTKAWISNDNKTV